MTELISTSHVSSAVDIPTESSAVGDYFVTHLSLSPQDAQDLQTRYYKDYGLAIAGLVLHHQIDPVEFNREVDDALPLDNIITPNPQLRTLLADLDREKVKPWLFTNAHITHGQRVVSLLGVQDMFEGITFCDYRKQPFVCKPHPEMFQKAEEESGAPSVKDCYFVGTISLSPLFSHPFLHSTSHNPLLTPPLQQMTLTSTAATRKPAAGQPPTCSSPKTQTHLAVRPHIKSAAWKICGAYSRTSFALRRHPKGRID